MKEDKLNISQDALQDTIAACHIEWQNVQMKLPRKRELLFRFMHAELKSYMRLSSIGLMICLIGGILPIEQTTVVVCCYMLIMGSGVLFELYRRKYYDTVELMAPVYLNNGRVFIFKMAGIALLEIIEFSFMCFILYMFEKLMLAQILLYGFVPVFFLQGLLFFCIPRLHKLSIAISAYCLSFFLYDGFMRYLNILQYITIEQLLCGLAMMIVLFYLLLIMHYFKKQRRSYVWN